MEERKAVPGMGTACAKPRKHQRGLRETKPGDIQEGSSWVADERHRSQIKNSLCKCMLRGVNFHAVNGQDPLEDFNCVSDKIGFVIQKAHSGSSSVGGMESGYPGDKQTHQEAMTIIRERENEDSSWRNEQIQRHFGSRIDGQERFTGYKH